MPPSTPEGLPPGVGALLGGSGTSVPVPADLVSVAHAFRRMHDARQRADYDHQFGVTKADTMTLVDAAATAIDTWRAMPDCYHSDVFLTLLGGLRPVKNG
jgi:hypothetical protein